MATDSLSLLKAVRAIHVRNPNNHFQMNESREDIDAQTAALLPDPDSLDTSEKAVLATCLAAQRACSGCTSPGESLILGLLSLYAEGGLTPEYIRWKVREFTEDFQYVSTIIDKHNIDFGLPQHQETQGHQPQQARN